MLANLISFVPLILFLTIIVFFYYRHKRKQKALGITQKKGVEGWLALLVLGLLVFGPLSSFSIITQIGDMERNTPSVLNNPNWSSYKSANMWLMAVFVGISIYGGYGLLKERTRSVVKRAYFVLWIIGPVRALITGLALPAIFFNYMNFSEDFFANFIQGLITAIIWSLYLRYSMRVADTYPENKFIIDKSLETIHE